MGYTTDFEGGFTLDKTLTDAHKAYLLKFAQTRRMKRNAELTALRPDPIRESVGLPVGEDGAYFVGAGGNFGQEEQSERGDIVDYNCPPGEVPMDHTKGVKDFHARYEEHVQEKNRRIRQNNAQPSLWCQWIPNDAGTEIVWDGGEKFYGYVDWIQYLIKNFLEPWGYILSGEVEWTGEDPDDRGKIVITGTNEVTVKVAKIEWEEV